MNADWKVIAGTLGIFAAGLAAGVLTAKLGEHSRHAPSSMMREFGWRQGPGADRFDRPGHGPEGGEHRWGGPDGHGPGDKPPFLTPEFEKQVHDYHEKLRAVLDPYQDKIKAILTADQQKKLEEARERRGPQGQGPDAPRPPRDGGPEPEGGMRFIGMIIYKPVLERMSHDLALDPKQLTLLDALFKDRREALLKFLDTNPPPTIRMALGNGGPGGPGAPAPTSAH